MAELAEAGCVGFFQGNALLPDAATLLQAMRYAATFGFTVWLRPQDAHLAEGGVAHEGEVATRLGLAPIPVIAETVALRTIVELMGATGARVHVARLSSAACVALVAEAKARGLPLTCDVAVHHLHLCDRDLGEFNTLCNLVPPLRDPSDRDALRRALADGTIDAVCSDHTPVDDDGKLVPFAEAEPGATGLELLLPLTLQWGREAGLKPAQALAAVTSRAARVLGVAAGTLAPGAAADICLFDAALPWIVKPAALASQGKNTPFLGLELIGRVVRTLVGGRTVHGG
jgi:dihydroorotase